MDDTGKTEKAKSWGFLARFSFAICLAGIMAICVYILINISSAVSPWIASIWFLAIFPAFLCAMIVFIIDPDGELNKRLPYYVPIFLIGLVIFVSVIFLREGIVCILMLSPIWLGSGYLGIYFYKNLRKKVKDRNSLNASFIVLPIILGMIEPQLQFPHEKISLTREIIISASPEEIWPYAVSNEYIADTEGQWNLTQNIIGLPRPRATTISHEGKGAIRTAYWGDNVNFEEVITEWRKNEYLGWDFSFKNSSIQDYIDNHISPDGEFLKIDKGFYHLIPIDKNHTKLVLQTDYIAKSHVNLYARLWGEFMLGDIQNNV